MNSKIIIGSRAFFEGLEGFDPKDTDYMEVVECGSGYKYMRQVSTAGRCLFSVVRRPISELLEWTLASGSTAMRVGKFLVPEAAEALGFSFDMLPRLAPMIAKLDDKHAYERVIYDAYLANGSMTLTDEQRAAAFASYKAARPDDGTSRRRRRRRLPEAEEASE